MYVGICAHCMQPPATGFTGRTHALITTVRTHGPTDKHRHVVQMCWCPCSPHSVDTTVTENYVSLLAHSERTLDALQPH